MAHLTQTISVFIIFILTNLTNQESMLSSLKNQKIYDCDNADPKRNETCNKDNVKHSNCIAGKCTCPEGSVQNMKKCQLVPGSRCYTDPEALSCGELASCKDDECGLYYCICNPPYETDDDKKFCAKYNGEPCSKDNPCGRNLLCLDNTCKCMDDAKYINGKCQGLIGSLCKTHCLDEAECRQGFCQCKQEYVLSNDRTCHLDNNYDCGEGRPPCAQFKGLVCRNEYCECQSNLAYNRKIRTCGGKSGADCKKSVEYILSLNGDNFKIDEKATSDACEQSYYDETIGDLEGFCSPSNNTCLSKNQTISSTSPESKAKSRSRAVQLRILDRIFLLACGLLGLY